ncbi:MAG: 5'-deoxyadenosine deaminase [Candidatus Gastranaerophilales bacterium]|nr:5'-deoxyadenosine deaminase [Candidatus Gastranaerophilales bacterium]
MSTILIKNADIITMNPEKEVFSGVDLLIENGIISKIGSNITNQADITLDAKGKVVMPGFVQTHVHLCQTLFRGLAENRQLLSWLREKIWPLEAAHDENSIYYSSLLGIGELISGGTTTVLDMGTVNHTDKIFEAMLTSGIRAIGGKAMMDSGNNLPENFCENVESSIQESLRLYEKWNGAENGRIGYAFAPRFILSCSDKLFSRLKELSDSLNIKIHTHACENSDEGKEVFRLKGMNEFEYFNKMGLLNKNFLAAHCVWADDNDIKLIKDNNVKVLHCPSSNFKLGSGTLNIVKLLNEGINVSIGADGAPCNNNLDMLQEIRTSALLQNVLNNSGSIDAYKFLEIATIDGAKTLGLDEEIGSIEAGKKADIIILDLKNDFHSWHSDEADIASRIVFSAKSSDVKTVIIDGKIVMKDRELLTVNKETVLNNCKAEIARLLVRVK